jgi:hypothetical protein
MDDARAALATFQKLKDEQAESALQRREARQAPDAAQPSPEDPQ